MKAILKISKNNGFFENILIFFKIFKTLSKSSNGVLFLHSPEKSHPSFVIFWNSCKNNAFSDNLLIFDRFLNFYCLRGDPHPRPTSMPPIKMFARTIILAPLLILNISLLFMALTYIKLDIASPNLWLGFPSLQFHPISSFLKCTLCKCWCPFKNIW